MELLRIYTNSLVRERQTGSPAAWNSMAVFSFDAHRVKSALKQPTNPAFHNPGLSSCSAERSSRFSDRLLAKDALTVFLLDDQWANWLKISQQILVVEFLA